MTTQFDFFEGTRSESRETPQVTVRRSGQMVLTPPAVAMLGDDVTHVQFGYDPDTGAVAIRAAPKDAKGRYRLREQSNGSKLADGRRFLGYHDLKVEKAQRFPAEEFGDGMVGFRFPEAEGEGQTAAQDTPSASKKPARTTKRKAATTA